MVLVQEFAGMDKRDLRYVDTETLRFATMQAQFQLMDLDEARTYGFGPLGCTDPYCDVYGCHCPQPGEKTWSAAQIAWFCNQRARIENWLALADEVIAEREEHAKSIAERTRGYDPERHDPDSVFYDGSYTGPSELELGGGCNRCGCPDDCMCYENWQSKREAQQDAASAHHAVGYQYRRYNVQLRMAEHAVVKNAKTRYVDLPRVSGPHATESVAELLDLLTLSTKTVEAVFVERLGYYRGEWITVVKYAKFADWYSPELEQEAA